MSDHDKLTHVMAMAEGVPGWNLSADDRAALKFVLECRDELLTACQLIRSRQLDYGPTDDGSTAGRRFEEACDDLAPLIAKVTGASPVPSEGKAGHA